MSKPNSETRIREAAATNGWDTRKDQPALGLVTFRKGRHYVDVHFDVTGRVMGGGTNRVNRRLTTAAAIIEILAK
jgi:hypothetical protein